MSLGYVSVSAPVTYAMPGEKPAQRTPAAVAMVSLHGPRGGFIGAEEVGIEGARAAHEALGALLAAHDGADANGGV